MLRSDLLGEDGDHMGDDTMFVQEPGKVFGEAAFPPTAPPIPI